MKRNEHIAGLSRDHHFGLLFGWKIKRGLEKEVDLKRIKSYVAFFWETDLKRHFEAEEKFLFTLKNDPFTETALSEHVLIRNLITAIIDTHKENAADYRALAILIEQHIRFEERTLFPYLESLFSAEQLQETGARLRAAEKDINRTDYDDDFWTAR